MSAPTITELTDRDKEVLEWAREQSQLPAKQFSAASSRWRKMAPAITNWEPAHRFIDEMEPEIPYYIAGTALRELIHEGLYETNALGQIRHITVTPCESQ